MPNWTNDDGISGFGIACRSDGTALYVNVKDLPMNDELRRIEQKLDEVLKILKSLPTTPGEYKKKTVDDADLDGKYGNPEVRLTPSKWSGPDYKGWKFSDCPPDFLDMMSDMLDAIARKQAQDPAKAKFADWSAKDAARARAWAERLRKNQSKTVAADDWDAAPMAGETDDPSFPF